MYTHKQGVLAQTSRPWHASKVFGPFALFDLQGKEDVPEGSASIVNRCVCVWVCVLFWDGRLGVTLG
jgi:hypothetical protein